MIDQTDYLIFGVYDAANTTIMYTFKFHIFYLDPLPYSDNGF